MTGLTYLTRRYAGVFYLRFRITTFSRRRRLLRFSLGTRDKLEARLRLTRYLAWLFAMQTAEKPAELFAAIEANARAMILKGPARTLADIDYRARFVETAWLHRADWLAERPCPVREHAAFALQEALEAALVMLHHMVDADKARLNAPGAGRGHPVNAPREAIYGLCLDPATGAIRRYLPTYMKDLFEELPDSAFGLREGELCLKDLYPERAISDWPSSFEPPALPIDSLLRAGRIEAARSGDAPAASAPPPPPTARTKEAPDDSAGATRLTDAKRDYLAAKRIANGDGRADEDAGLIIDFLIDFIGDKPVGEITADELHAFEIAMARTPDRLGIPKPYAGSLHARYLYAEAHGLDGLKPLTERRIRNVWHRCLHQFFDWMRQKQRGRIDYRFDLVPDRPAEGTKRDAWTDAELLKLFSLPLFTGCASPAQIWTPGRMFVQNELYWAYLLIFFTGMRNSEIGTLKVADVVCEEGVWFFDLGTRQRRTTRRTQAAAAEAPKRKSRAGLRRVPVPKLLQDLGLLDRVEDLKAAGVAALFPEWKPFRNRKSGRDMPGHHLSKSWQYIKTKFAFEGDELTIYGGRHTRAEWYDLINLPELIKRKLLGHAPRDAHEGYGANALTVEEARLALGELPIETQIAGLLILAKQRAAYGELTIARTW